MKNRYDTRTATVKRKIKLPRVAVILTALVLFGFAVFFVIRFIAKHASQPSAAAELETLWAAKDYESIYTLTETLLHDVPFQNLALTYRGYAAFFLALAQTDPQQAQSYMDTAVNSLRLSLISAKKNLKPQIEYMLGKTYFHKNILSAYHYYADLAVHYLTEALASGYTADDIYEYLGLSYADLGMTNESIAAFTEALSVNSSETLLLAIARQYYKNGQTEAAKPYLYRIKNMSTDEVFILTCAQLLGDIYISENNFADAKAEFEMILKKDPNAADAYYGLGLIYEQEGDLIKARAHWRKALKAQVNHPGALHKIDSKK
ncbi:tetratricopeptide repeat protein [Treponema sp. OMZ 840]|uniref:tetratricopeptide repeat protein n=1 Tax=Treponema sp. OMZ 840 TaxID=244313 RepID=UPI003D94900C